MEETTELLEVEKMTPLEVSKVLHTTAETIRAGLRHGKFPFGIAFKGTKGNWIYIIIKSKFYNWLNDREE